MTTLKKILRFSARALPGLLAAMTLLPSARAQTTNRPVENRVLMIFDTSSTMKKRVPAEVKGIKRLFAITLSAQLRRGDSIGVWTFSEDVQPGALPLERWRPQDIITISSNIIDLIQTQHYAKATSYEKLMPMLDRVVAASPELTTFIFCDGGTPFSGTPYDPQVNDIFKKNESLMRKVHEPFVIVLRSENGKYTASTINTAEAINVPQFPLPPQPAPPPVMPEPPAPPRSTLPPLVIIGTSVGTNVPPPGSMPVMPPPMPPAPPAVVVPTNPAPQAGSTPPTPPPLAPATNTAPPAAASVPPANPAPTAPTPPPVAPPVVAQASTPPAPPMAAQVPAPPIIAPSATTQSPGNSATNKKGFVAIGIGCLVLAGIACFVVSRFSRRKHTTSLITESLKKR